MLLCVLALSHFSITSTADVAPLLREALYDEVYVRLHGAEAARKLLELVPVLESAYTTELRRHPFLAAARRSPLDNSTKKANIGRIASLMSMRAGLLELRSWASPGETADPANRTTRGRDAAERRATATMLPPEREGYELGAGLMSEAEIVFFSAHADMKSYYATGEQKRGAGSGPMSLVIGFALSAVLFVSVSWVAVKQGWIGSEEEGYGVLGA